MKLFLCHPELVSGPKIYLWFIRIIVVSLSLTGILRGDFIRSQTFRKLPKQPSFRRQSSRPALRRAHTLSSLKKSTLILPIARFKPDKPLPVEGVGGYLAQSGMYYPATPERHYVPEWKGFYRPDETGTWGAIEVQGVLPRFIDTGELKLRVAPTPEKRGVPRALEEGDLVRYYRSSPRYRKVKIAPEKSRFIASLLAEDKGWQPTHGGRLVRIMDQGGFEWVEPKQDWDPIQGKIVLSVPRKAPRYRTIQQAGRHLFEPPEGERILAPSPKKRPWDIQPKFAW